MIVFDDEIDLSRFAITALVVGLIVFGVIPCASGAHAQVIHSLPEKIKGSSEVSVERVLAAFDTVYSFSETLHAARKLNSPQPDTVTLSGDRWPAGSWGRGYYTRRVDYNPGRFPRYYDQWYGAEDNSPEGCTPLIRETGRRILAYLRILSASESADNRFPKLEKRVLDGLRYLLDEQRPSGGFVWWYRRAGLNDCSSSAVASPNIYSTSIALRALSGAYVYLQQSYADQKTELKRDVVSALGSSVRFLANRKGLFQTQEGSNANYRAFAVWAFAGAYEAIGYRRWLRTALRIARPVVSNQREDGAWMSILGAGDDIWHDTKINYHGIILRGLAALYEVLPPSWASERALLRESMLAGVNHVINYNGVPSETQQLRTRIAGDNRFYIYHRNDETPGRSVQATTGSSMYLIQGLLYAREALTLGAPSKDSLNALIHSSAQGVVRLELSAWTPSPDYDQAQVLHTPKYKGVDVTTLSLGLYVAVRKDEDLLSGKEFFQRP